MIERSIQEGITLLNIYAPDIGAPQYIMQELMAIKVVIDSNIIIMKEFNTPLTQMDRTSRQKINKKIQALHPETGSSLTTKVFLPRMPQP